MEDKILVEKVREQMEIPADIMAKAEGMITKTMPFVRENGVTFDEYACIGFASHLANLASRMTNGETLPPVCDEVLAELEPDIMELSKQVTAIWTDTYGGVPDGAEQVLVAIHLQTARAKAAR